MQAVSTGVRWLLVPVVLVAMPVVAAMVGRLAVGIADAQCPTAHMVGGACVAPWHTGIVEMSIYAAVALGATSMVAVPALVAPSYHRTVALIGLTLAVGLTATAYLQTSWPDLLPPLGITAAIGGVTLAWICVRRIHDR